MLSIENIVCGVTACKKFLVLEVCVIPFVHFNLDRCLHYTMYFIYIYIHMLCDLYKIMISVVLVLPSLSM